MNTNKQPEQPARYAVGDVVRYTTQNSVPLKGSGRILEVFTNGTTWFYVLPWPGHAGETMFIGECEIDGLVTPGEM